MLEDKFSQKPKARPLGPPRAPLPASEPPHRDAAKAHVTARVAACAGILLSTRPQIRRRAAREGTSICAPRPHPPQQQPRGLWLICRLGSSHARQATCCAAACCRATSVFGTICACGVLTRLFIVRFCALHSLRSQAFIYGADEREYEPPSIDLRDYLTPRGSEVSKDEGATLADKSRQQEVRDLPALRNPRATPGHAPARTCGLDPPQSPPPTRARATLPAYPLACAYPPEPTCSPPWMCGLAGRAA